MTCAARAISISRRFRMTSISSSADERGLIEDDGPAPLLGPLLGDIRDLGGVSRNSGCRRGCMWG